MNQTATPSPALMPSIHVLPLALTRIILADFTSLCDNNVMFMACLKTWLAAAVAILYGLYILAYPPSTSLRRKLSIVLLAVPTGYAFIHHMSFLPSWALCDSFGRATYIWFAHMSHEVCVLEYTPTIDEEWEVRGNSFVKVEGDTKSDDEKMGIVIEREVSIRIEQASTTQPGPFSETIIHANKSTNAPLTLATTEPEWRFRLHAAAKVLFCINSSTSLNNPSSKTPLHSLNRDKFLCYHLHTVTYLYVAQALWYTFSPEAAFWISRLPTTNPITSLFRWALLASWPNLDQVLQWNVINLWLYESHHSLFALFFVGTGIDQPHEWNLSLFRPLSTAWSVRRYWGVHWHSYIYASFQGHTKILTRQWLDMPYGIERRVLENTLVFALSGVAHSAVRGVQDWGHAQECWVIAVWYTLQMLPIIIETVVENSPVVKQWKRKAEKQYPRLTATVCTWIGYAWVFAWFMWCVPAYTRVKHKLSSKRFRTNFMFRHDKNLAKVEARRRTIRRRTAAIDGWWRLVDGFCAKVQEGTLSVRQS